MAAPPALEQAVMDRQGKKAGREIVFLCPAHPDVHPSANYNPEKETWICRVCGAKGGWTDLAARLDVQTRTETTGKLIVGKFAAAPGTVVATYPYTDEAGELLYEKQRFEPKTFKQRKPSGNGWTYKLGEVRRVLYRLPTLVAADPKIGIFIVEGEKDADRLAAAGCIATTNDSGAGKWAGTYTEALRGRHVIILPDNDTEGRKHAALVSTALSGVVASVRVIELPGLPEKGDVSDWMDAGGTPEQLEALVVATPIMQPKPGRATPTRMKAKDLMGSILPPIKWAVPDFLPEGVTLLAGRPKSGKSWLALQLALGVSSGTTALGRPVIGGEVLYVALEDRMGRLQNRMGIQSEDEALITNRLELWTECPRIDDGGLDQIAAWCDANPEARMVIIDTLQKIRGKQKANGNQYEDDYATVGTIKERIADAYGVSVVIIHHTRKMSADNPLESISGTQGISGAADAGMVLLRQAGTVEAVLHSTGRDVEETQLALAWHGDICTWELIGDAEHHRLNAERRAIVDTLTEAGEPLTARELAGRLGRKVETLKVTLHRMARNGELESTGTGKYTTGVTAVTPETRVTGVTAVTGGASTNEITLPTPSEAAAIPPVTPVTAVTPVSSVTPVTPPHMNGVAREPLAVPMEPVPPSAPVTPRDRNDDGRCAMPDCRGIVVTWEIDPDRPHMYTGVCKHGHQNWMRA